MYDIYMNLDSLSQLFTLFFKRHGKRLIAILSILYLAFEALQSFPYSSPLRHSTLAVQNEIDNIGLYGRTWAMFAATNTNTSTVTLLMTYADGTQQSYQYLYLRPGYLPTVWNEVMQDIQYDDNNDTQGLYKAGFLRYTCTHPPIGTELPTQLELLQNVYYFTASNPSYHATSNDIIIGSTSCAS